MRAMSKRAISSGRENARLTSCVGSVVTESSRPVSRFSLGARLVSALTTAYPPSAAKGGGA